MKEIQLSGEEIEIFEEIGNNLNEHTSQESTRTTDYMEAHSSDQSIGELNE